MTTLFPHFSLHFLDYFFTKTLPFLYFFIPTIDMKQPTSRIGPVSAYNNLMIGFSFNEHNHRKNLERHFSALIITGRTALFLRRDVRPLVRLIAVRIV